MPSVLLVEDNQDMLFVLGEMCRMGGHVVSSAANGKEAEEQMKSKNFDIVVTDMVMPEMDGIELIQRMKNFPHRPKIIAMSGGGVGPAAAYLELAKKLGAQTTLVKPFSLQSLLDALSFENDAA